MKITIGKMDKKINSTKHKFTGQKYENIDAKLKEPCDEDNPSFLLKYNDGYEQCNYVHVPKWGYYWVTDRVHPTNELIELHCHKDVLATGIPYLSNHYMYASYCSDSTVATEGSIMDDPRLGPDILLETGNFNFLQHDESLIKKYFVDDPGSGTVLMTVMGKDVGPITYALPVYLFIDVCSVIANGEALDTYDNFVRLFWGDDWHAAVQSALYIPIATSAFDNIWESTTTSLWWGSVEITFSSAVRSSKSPIAMASNSYVVELPFHEKLKEAGSPYAFLKGEKYTEVSFQGPTGSINLSSDAFKYNNDIVVVESFSLLDGTFTMKFFSAGLGSAPIGQYSCQLGWDWMKQTAFMSSTNEQSWGMIVSGAKMLPSIAAALMGAGAPAGGIAASGGASFLKQYSAATGEHAYAKAIGAEMSQVANAAGSIGTGIMGTFMGGAAGGVCKSSSSSSGIEGYFVRANSSWQSKRTFHITVATNVPSICSGDDGLNKTGLARFRTTYGYPCNKMIRLDEIEAPYCYLQTVGDSVGMDWEYKATTTEWPLDLKELAELNGLLNSGIYIEKEDTE